MFTGQVEIKDIGKVDPEYVDLLRRVMAIQADCEIGGPHLYVEHMMDGAPSRIDRLVVARTSAEEIDHFRKFAKIAGDLGVDTSYLLSRPNTERYVEAFRGLIKNWEDFTVFGFLVDRVGKYQLEEYIGSTFVPLAQMFEHPSKVLEEEEGHIDYGTTRTAELAAQGEEGKQRAQRAVDFWYVKALDMFGNSGSYRSQRYIEWGLKRRQNEEARQQFMGEVNPMIEQMGLQVPDPLKGRQYL
jgi:ring-1,2-phenylacetyl-CoA epoxidase subunit PaaA